MFSLIIKHATNGITSLVRMIRLDFIKVTSTYQVDKYIRK